MTGRPRPKFSLLTLLVAVNVAGVVVWGMCGSPLVEVLSDLLRTANADWTIAPTKGQEDAISVHIRNIKDIHKIEEQHPRWAEQVRRRKKKLAKAANGN